MATVLQIKNREFGEGRPLICVPVMACTKEEIIEEIQDKGMCGKDAEQYRTKHNIKYIIISF